MGSHASYMIPPGVSCDEYSVQCSHHLNERWTLTVRWVDSGPVGLI